MEKKSVKVTMVVSEPAHARLVELAEMMDCEIAELVRRSFRFLEWGLTRCSDGWDLELRKGQEIVPVEIDFLQAVKPIPRPQRNLRLVFSNPEPIDVKTTSPENSTED